MSYDLFHIISSIIVLFPFPFACIVSVRGFTIEWSALHITISQRLGWKHGGVREVIAVVLESVLLRKQNVLSKTFTYSQDRSVDYTGVTQRIWNKQGSVTFLEHFKQSSRFQDVGFCCAESSFPASRRYAK